MKKQIFEYDNTRNTIFENVVVSGQTMRVAVCVFARPVTKEEAEDIVNRLNRESDDIVPLLEKIRFLSDFIVRWDAEKQTMDEQNNMIDEWHAFSKKYNPSEMSADELLAELKDQLGCIIDGKY